MYIKCHLIISAGLILKGKDTLPSFDGQHMSRYFMMAFS